MNSISRFIPLLLFVFHSTSSAITTGQQPLSYDVIYDWKSLDFEFSPESQRQEYISSKKFIKENNVLSGVGVCGSHMYFTVPRLRPGVPATLTRLPYDHQTQQHVSGSKLKPYPSWQMNELGNCDALQNVHAMEIDQFCRMWVIDVGRVHIDTDSPDNKCPPKLVLIDLQTDKVLRTYVFPEQVVSRTSNFLNDIAVGCTTKEDCWAYITDDSDGKIIVYSHQQNKGWYVKHEDSMKAQEEAKQIQIEGKSYTFNQGVQGIALAPCDSNFNTLYYSPLSSYHLYSFNVERIRNQLKETSQHGIDLDSQHVKDLGRKPSQSGGMIMDANGGLYYGLLGKNAVYKWDSSQTGLTDQNQIQLLHHDQELQWPHMLTIDERGDGFVTSNRLHRFKTNTYDFNEVNMRVLRFHLGTMNYMRSGRGGGQQGRC